MLGAEKFDEPKTVICISDVLVWGDTPLKLVEKTPQDPLTEEEQEILAQFQAETEAGVTEQPVDTPTEGEEPAPRKDGPKFYKQVPFEEGDYSNRKAPQQYEAWKTLETLFLTTGMKKENLNVYIICAGVLYGQGEMVFGPLFMSAWLERPPALLCSNPGSNQVPTIHVTDLCRAIKFVVESKPETHYIFAVDNTSDRSQRSLIQGIASGIGTGELDMRPKEELEVEEWLQPLSIDLWVTPSKLLIPPKAEDEEEPKMPFDWHCLAGLSANIKTLNEEYNKEKQLRPIKIFITGPPASGKTHYGKMLAEHYNVPLIQVHGVVEAASSLTSNLGDQIRAKLDELREAMQAKPKQKGAKAEVPRLPDDLLTEAFLWRLSQNHCRNRGFVLDGWPRTFQDAERLFLVKAPPVVSEDGAVEPSDDKLTLNKALFPENIIVLREPVSKDAKKDFLLQRVKNLPEEQIAGTHYTEQDMNRRMAKYREANASDRGDPAVQDFFARNGVEVFSVDCSKEAIEAFESLRIYIERSGRPDNFLEKAEDLNEQRLAYLQKKATEDLANRQFEADRKTAMAQEDRNKREMRAMMQFDRIKEREEEIRKAREMPLRDYLMDNVIPALAEGLLEVCRVLPDDPVDYLAEYLFKHSNDS
jgi:adenylate kinase